MDVKVITRHTPSNYGSLLQSIATIRAIESLGHTCSIIDYWRADERGMRAVTVPLSRKAEWNRHPLKRLLYIALRYPGEKMAEMKFRRMRDRYLSLTRTVSSPEALRQMEADVYLTGSDQVWGPMPDGELDLSYFLDFAASGRKVAYAASFGKTQLGADVEPRLQRLLGRYDRISVRESHAVEMIEALGLDTPAQVLDPTLLLDAGQWGEMATAAPAQPYLLVYQIHNNHELNRYAKAASRLTGLPIRRVTPYLHHASRGGAVTLLPDIGRFLGLIRGARLMVTDSFHGTAFAINFNTPFVEVLPTNGTSSRNVSILQLTGLTGRIATSADDLSLATAPIDFTEANAAIARERQHSLAELRRLIEG